MPSPAETPYTMKDDDHQVNNLTIAVPSFKSERFMESSDARIIRILCEFQEPAQRLNQHRIKGTVLFFGSARAMSRTQFDSTKATLETNIAASEGEEKDKLNEKLAALLRVEWMCEWVDTCERLAKMITEWAVSNPLLHKVMAQVPDYLTNLLSEEGEHNQQCLVVTTGGGPGLMEAANRGAASVPGAKTMGMGVTLPFEKGLNPYVSDGLAFQFHYFFTRKFWMMYSARALVIAPGGFGTLDELFELLTLRQTKKIPELPVVLLGQKFWKTVINWQALAEFGTVSQKEIDSLFFVETAEEAFMCIKKYYDGMNTAYVTQPSPALRPLDPPNMCGSP